MEEVLRHTLRTAHGINMRILGLDFGSKTVGVAVSDELLITAQGVEIVRRKSPSKLRQTWHVLRRLLQSTR